MVIPEYAPETTDGLRGGLLRAAEQAFGREGYSGASVAAITSIAGVGISTFYRCFESKEALLTALTVDLMGRLRERLSAARAGVEQRSVLEQLAVVRETYELAYDTFLERPNLVRALLAARGTSEAVDRLISAELEALALDLAEDLRRCEAQGLVVIPHPDIVAHALVGSVVFLVEQSTYTGTPSRDEAVEISMRMTMGTLLAYATPEVFDALGPMFRLLLQSPRT